MTSAVPHHRVVIVGAGFSGIVMGARLRRAGIEDFIILEKADDVGGTWRDNRYPGCACDVPSRLYSLADAPHPGWSREFAGWAEIWDYLRACVRRFGLTDRVRTGADVTSAVWESGRWRVEAADGREWTAGALVLGVGGLHVPSRPAIPGLADFAGPVLHTAQWPADDSALDGARVAVVGTGASAVQAIPALAPRTDRLTVLQRSASWIMPRHDHAWSPARQRLYARIPWTQKATRWLRWGRQEVQLLGFARVPGVRPRLERMALDRLARHVPDPQTRAKLTPDYEIGCKRILLSDDYWRTFARDDVELVTDPIARIEPHAVVTRDATGAEAAYPVDALVLATGFDLLGSYARMHVAGLGGRTLAQEWAGERGTHLGITVAGFPELYLLLGPNTALGHSSVLLQIESAASYIVQALARADRLGPQVVTRRAQQRFGRWVQGRTRGTAWGSGCRSWYLDEKGRNVAIWPASTARYRLVTRRVRAADYESVGPLRPD